MFILEILFACYFIVYYIKLLKYSYLLLKNNFKSAWLMVLSGNLMVVVLVVGLYIMNKDLIEWKHEINSIFEKHRLANEDSLK